MFKNFKQEVKKHFKTLQEGRRWKRKLKIEERQARLLKNTYTNQRFLRLKDLTFNKFDIFIRPKVIRITRNTGKIGKDLLALFSFLTVIYELQLTQMMENLILKLVKVEMKSIHSQIRIENLQRSYIQISSQRTIEASIKPLPHHSSIIYHLLF